MGTICVVGLGYVGVPLSVAFGKEGHDVIGYDIDEGKVNKINNGVDPSGDFEDKMIEQADIRATTDPTFISDAEYVIVTVPTPVDDLKNPKLEYVEEAGQVIGKYIESGTTVILESTVYPGATREVLAPSIEETSGLASGEGFYIGYSPERIVPGDESRGIQDIVKIVSGQTDEVLEDIASLYESIIHAGIHKAPEIEVAEAAKAIENVQRDVNIALMNELAIACYNIGLDTHEVLKAARTKWNFHDYRPGLVGGHCIPVDPFYIIHESKRQGYIPELIETGRKVNEYMPTHIADLLLRELNNQGKVLCESTVLILGLAYKPGVGDVRTSAVDKAIERLQVYDVDVIGFDPHADQGELEKEFDTQVADKIEFSGIDAVLLATPHKQCQTLDYSQMESEMNENPILLDVDHVLDGEKVTKTGIKYVSL